MKIFATILPTLLGALVFSQAAQAFDSTQQDQRSGAFGPNSALNRTQQFGNMKKAVPFGGAGYRDMQRRQDVKLPSSTICALHEQTRDIGTTRQDASGKVTLFNDPRNQQNANGNIYDDCDKALVRGFSPRKTDKLKSAYNARTNTLNAATDGYVNRSATSSMMPKRAESMYDPLTGTLKPPKRPNAYSIYQQ